MGSSKPVVWCKLLVGWLAGAAQIRGKGNWKPRDQEPFRSLFAGREMVLAGYHGRAAVVQEDDGSRWVVPSSAIQITGAKPCKSK